MKTLLLFSLLISVIYSYATQKDSLLKYSEYIEELDKGNYDINYENFRISYIYSTEFKSKRANGYDSLKKEVYKEMSLDNYAKIKDLCIQMLDIDYTSMFAHKILQQTAKILGETDLHTKHHDIEFGLLNSILASGDGKTCQSSWVVTQLEEEYFILRMLGAELKMQSLVGGCDKMDVKIDRKKRTYYFGVYYVFLGRKM